MRSIFGSLKYWRTFEWIGQIWYQRLERGFHQVLGQWIGMNKKLKITVGFEIYLVVLWRLSRIYYRPKELLANVNIYILPVIAFAVWIKKCWTDALTATQINSMPRGRGLVPTHSNVVSHASPLYEKSRKEVWSKGATLTCPRGIQKFQLRFALNFNGILPSLLD